MLMFNFEDIFYNGDKNLTNLKVNKFILKLYELYQKLKWTRERIAVQKLECIIIVMDIYWW